MPHAVVVLVGRIVGADLVETVTTSELLDLLLLHTEATHSFLALDAEIHLVADEEPGAPALIVNVRRLVRGQLVHRAHIDDDRIFYPCVLK